MPRRALLLAALLVPGIPLAQPTLALRLAYAPSILDAADRVPMTDVMPGQFPLQVDLLWRLGPAFTVGPYASWGLGLAGSAGCEGADCSASSARVGVQAIWSAPARLLEGVPWLGAGAGWEWATRRRERLGSGTTYRWNGPEGLAQAGVEWAVGERLRVGPFLLLALGSYGDLTLETSGGSASSGIHDRTLHAWLHAGVRGRLDL